MIQNESSGRAVHEEVDGLDIEGQHGHVSFFCVALPGRRRGHTAFVQAGEDNECLHVVLPVAAFPEMLSKPVNREATAATTVYELYHHWAMLHVHQGHHLQTSSHRWYAALISLVSHTGRPGTAAISAPSRSSFVTYAPSVVTACKICYVAGTKRLCVSIKVLLLALVNVGEINEI